MKLSQGIITMELKNDTQVHGTVTKSQYECEYPHKVSENDPVQLVILSIHSNNVR